MNRTTEWLRSFIRFLKDIVYSNTVQWNRPFKNVTYIRRRITMSYVTSRNSLNLNPPTHYPLRVFHSDGNGQIIYIFNSTFSISHHNKLHYFSLINKLIATYYINDTVHGGIVLATRLNHHRYYFAISLYDSLLHTQKKG